MSPATRRVSRPTGPSAHSVDGKRIALAYGIELTVAAASLAGAYLFARRYAPGDPYGTALMMLAPLAYAALEVARVPLAVSVRTHASKPMRVVAALAVACAAGVTVKSVSQLGEAAFEPRLAAVREAGALMALARDAKASLASKVASADLAVTRGTEAVREARARVSGASASLSSPLPDKCVDSRDRKGRPIRRCVADSRVQVLAQSLQSSESDRARSEATLARALAARDAVDPIGADEALSAAKGRYAEAVRGSQVHGFAAMAFGEDPVEVTDAQVAAFLRVFVLVPAFLVAVASTLLALTAVGPAPSVPEPAKRKAPTRARRVPKPKAPPAAPALRVVEGGRG